MLSKLHLHSTIIFIQNVTFIFYSCFYPFKGFHPFKNVLFIQDLLRISLTHGSNALPVANEPGAVQKGWNFEKNTEYTFQVSTMASF